MDWKEIVDKIFINRDLYYQVEDEDKEAAFFIINRKFGKQFPEISQKFNHKNIDKPTAIDLWYEYFKEYKGLKLPSWYWDPKDRVKNTKASKKSDYDPVKLREDLKDYDIKFLEKFFEEDLKIEMKKINKFDD